MGWVALFVVVGKLAGAGKEMVVAYRFGLRAEVDAYVFVSNLVNWPIAVWMGVIGVVMVPLAARLRRSSNADLALFRAELLGLSLVLGTLLAAIASWVLPRIVGASWTGMPAETAHVALQAVPRFVWVIPFGFAGGVLSMLMLASGRHANTMLEGVPAVVIAGALLVVSDPGIETLVWATVAGGALHVASLALPLAVRGEVSWPRFARRSPAWAPFWTGFGITMVGQALMSLVSIIDQFFAASLGTGAIATLNYAGRMLGLLLGVGATAVGRATLPVFSNLESRDNAVRDIGSAWVRVMLLAGILGIGIGWYLAPWGVRILFERGAFTAADSVVVCDVFRASLFQLPFYLAGLVLVSTLASRRMYRQIALGAMANVAVKVVANFCLVPLMGVYGVVTGTVLMYVVSFGVLWMFASRVGSKGRAL